MKTYRRKPINTRIWCEWAVPASATMKSDFIGLLLFLGSFSRATKVALLPHETKEERSLGVLLFC